MNKLSSAIVESVLWFKKFFEADNGAPSMTRLLCFMAFFPASDALDKHFSEVVFGAYLTAFVVQYVGGKWADVIGTRPVAAADGGNMKVTGSIDVSQ